MSEPNTMHKLIFGNTYNEFLHLIHSNTLKSSGNT